MTLKSYNQEQKISILKHVVFGRLSPPQKMPDSSVTLPRRARDFLEEWFRNSVRAIEIFRNINHIRADEKLLEKLKRIFLILAPQVRILSGVTNRKYLMAFFIRIPKSKT